MRFDKNFIALISGGENRSLGLPGIGALAGSVATRYFAGNNSGAQLPFCEVVGGIHVFTVQEGEQVLSLLSQAVCYLFLDVVFSLRQQHFVGLVLQFQAALPVDLCRNLLLPPLFFDELGSFEQGIQFL